jgi:excisionase family DNA binding protein
MNGARPLDARELAEELRVSKITIYRMAHAGLIPSYNVGIGKKRRNLRFDLAAVLEAMKPSEDPWAQPDRSRRARRVAGRAS